MWLSPEKLTELTKRKRGSSQCRALDRLGIPYRVGLDGRPVVFERDLTARHEVRQSDGPRFDRA